MRIIDDPLHLAPEARAGSRKKRKWRVKIKKTPRKERPEDEDEINELREQIERLEKELVEVEHDLFIESDVKRSNEVYRLEKLIEEAQNRLKDLVEGNDEDE